MTKRWMALLALTVAVVLAACGDGEDDRIIIELTSTPAATAELTSTPAATATPSADISSQFIDGVEVLPFTVGDEVELPDDVALIIETGCVNCHCPCIFGLVRAHRDASGEVRTENMFAGNILGNFALDDNASEIVVGVCSRGYCGPVEAISADAQTTLRRSVDGGATWEDVDVLEGAQAVIATTEEGILLNGRHGPGQEAQSGFWFFPSGDSIESSVEADVWRMISLPDGERAWLTTTGDLLRNDGSDFLAFDNVKQVLGIVLNYAGDGLVIEWSSSVESDRQHFLGTVGPDGYLLNALSSPAGGTRFGAWLTPTQAIGNAYVIPPGVEFDGTPGFWRFVIFDFESSTIHPIAMPSDLGGRGVLAVVQSPAD